VLLGVGLLKHEIERFGGLGPASLAINVIIAHEFGHIVQYKAGLSLADEAWQIEPHADFLAGWFLGERYGKVLSDDQPYLFHPVDMEAAVITMSEKGDTNFNKWDHHGEPAFRAAMVRAGYDAYHVGQLGLKDAFNKGRQMASLKVCELLEGPDCLRGIKDGW
jgi:predicted metalloprotease